MEIKKLVNWKVKVCTFQEQELRHSENRNIPSGVLRIIVMVVLRMVILRFYKKRKLSELWTSWKVLEI